MPGRSLKNNNVFLIQTAWVRSYFRWHSTTVLLKNVTWSYVLNILTLTTSLGSSFGFKGLSLIHRWYRVTLPFGSAHNTSPVIVTMGPAAPVVITCEILFRRMSVTTPGGIAEMFIAMVLHSLTGSAGKPSALRARICV